MAVNRTSYSESATEAAKAVMLEIVRLLGEYKDDMAIIGGWVPELLLPNAQPRHVGSVDVDIALNHEAIDNEVYRTITEHLKRAGYKEGDRPYKFLRTLLVGDQQVTVEVDFLAGEYGGLGKARRHQQVQDLKVRKARGCDLVFEINQVVRIEGQLPSGAKDAARVKVAGVVPFLVMKGMALADRMKEKDAWDVWFCLRNYPGGTKALAELFLPHIHHGLVLEGLKKISEKFVSVDHVGPRWVADFDELELGEARDIRLREAFELVNDLMGPIGIQNR
jgi:hypothetical protein